MYHEPYRSINSIDRELKKSRDRLTDMFDRTIHNAGSMILLAQYEIEYRELLAEKTALGYHTATPR